MSGELRRNANPAHIVIAVGAVMVGILLLLDNLGVMPSRHIWHYWPVILMMAGAVHVLQPGSGFHKALGGFLVVIGWLLLANNLGFLDFRVWDMWPVLLIFWGAMLLARTLRGDVRFFRHATVISDVDQVSFFGGTRRVVTGEQFQGGNITAVFGGAEIDLRQAAMTGDLTSIEAHVIFGGAEIKVPQGWDVSVRGVGVFGGFSDETLHPSPGTPGVKRLVVRGSAVFGGVNVKN